jgi:serine phosphatase RsbU (regulator of sigma subunit)
VNAAAADTFERKLFDLVESISQAQVDGAFTRALAAGIQQSFGQSLQLIACADLQVHGSAYAPAFAIGEPVWGNLPLALSVRTVQRRLRGSLWWVQRGLKYERDGTPAWCDAILLPIDRYLRHVLGLITVSMAAEEGQQREQAFHVLGQVIRLFTDRHQQHERLQEILTLARAQQVNLLQSELPPVPGYEIAAVSIEQEEVGGDYWQLIPLTRYSVAAAVADAKGKGFEAAMLVTGLHSALHVVNETPFKVAYKVQLLNRSLAQKGDLRNLISLFYAEFEEEGRVIYANCSHPPPMVVRADGEIDMLSAGGLFLGLDPTTEYRSGVCELNSGDVVVIYTDGWTELFNDQGEEFGADRLREVIRSMHGREPREVIDRVQQTCDEFRADAPFDDDRTLLVLKKN